jgi:hypothetical protein
MMGDDDTQPLPVLPFGFSLRKRRRMFNFFAQNRAQVLRQLRLAVDFVTVLMATQRTPRWVDASVNRPLRKAGGCRSTRSVLCASVTFALPVKIPVPPH